MLKHRLFHDRLLLLDRHADPPLLLLQLLLPLQEHVLLSTLQDDFQRGRVLLDLLVVGRGEVENCALEFLVLELSFFVRF